MIVDAHNHLVWPSNKPGAKPVLLDRRVLVDSGVIDKAWILSTGDCFKHPLANQDDEVLRLAKEHPKFFIPFAYLDFEEPPESVDGFHERGFAGLKAIFPPGPYDDERFFPFYEKAERRRMPILFHVGGSPYWHPSVLGVPEERLASKNMFIQTLDLVAKVFPKLVIICAHMGGKHAYHFALFFAKGHSNVYLDIACSILRDEPDKMKDVLQLVPADKLLFGSDSRGDTPIKKALFWKYYFETRLWADEATKDKILGLNAERILAESGYDPGRIK